LNAFTNGLSSQIVLPIVDSNQQLALPEALKLEMTFNGLNVFYYCDTNGTLTPNVAGVANKEGTTLAMFPMLQAFSGVKLLLQSLYEFNQKGFANDSHDLSYYSRPK